MNNLEQFLKAYSGTPGVATMIYCDRLLTTMHDDMLVCGEGRVSRPRMGLENVPGDSPDRRVDLFHLNDEGAKEFWKAAYGIHPDVRYSLPIYTSRWPKSQSMSESRRPVEKALDNIEDKTYFRAGVRAPEEELQLAEALKNYFYDLGAVALKRGDRNAEWILDSGLLGAFGSWIVIEGKVSR